MSKTFDIKSYKLSKQYIKDVDLILEIYKTTIQSLKEYKSYKSVQRVMSTLYDEKSMLDAHRVGLEKIVKSKGLRKENG